MIDSLSLRLKMNEFYSMILAVNGLCDMVFSCCIFLQIPPFSLIHMSFWKDPNDRENPAARHLMGFLILMWGSMRLASSAGIGLECACASYLLEGIVFGLESLAFGRMHAGQGTAVALVSFALALWLSSDEEMLA